MFKAPVLSVILALFPASSFAEDYPCGNAEETRAVDYVLFSLSLDDRNASAAQYFLHHGFGYSDMAIDGKIGPKTKSALCSTLVDYMAITGAKVYAPSDTQKFMEWMSDWTAQKQQALQDGTSFEAPD